VSRRGLVVVASLVALVLALVAFLAVRATDDGGRSTPADARIAAAVHAAGPASTPFAGLTEVRLAVGGRCLRLAVADTEAERVEGLRTRADLGPYDGMLFVFPGPSDDAFTMSTVPVDLSIAFFRGNGSRDSTRLMLACPHSEAECPVYRSAGTYEYALETLRGRLPAGALSTCS
jgi:uncharacterized membrane protein (UPF0127 family)